MEKTTTLFPERDPRITTVMLQALADLGYPRAIWNSMKYNEIKQITDDQVQYKSLSVISSDKISRSETESKTVVPKYEGTPQHEAAYELDLDTLQGFDWEALESRDQNGETPLHLAVMMAFQDFTKAEKIIDFLKTKGIDLDLMNNNGLTALEIAKQRATITPAYQAIVTALEK